MRVLVAGATGVVGRQLLPLLATAGHRVTALARTPQRGSDMERTGADVVIGDALDADAVDAAVAEAAPDAIVNMLTAIPAAINPRRIGKQFELTNRLRTEGTVNLLAAAGRHGVGRTIGQGVAFAYDPDGGDGPADEDAPWWPAGPGQFAPILAALRELEARVTAADGLVLRLGHLYGPGTALAADGTLTAAVRRGRVPLIGGGTATFSFLHTHDAATAILAALDHPRATGALNIVDDDPVRADVWLPHLAELLDARPPAALPAPLARLLVGSWGVDYMTRLRGASNARARDTLAWHPDHPTWRDGFAHELAPTAHPAAHHH
ncbi:NAD(P)-dependent oxidoreductase [Streptomyces sp. SM12]|uniref:NAD-dependent epimerase/dehydratase family protein n=1 Tax=Streptomyces sp. SM12 TaxID=1071602 RepID=UPI000CD55FE3|nr:NAD(P)-dependent oxidoreductase [Streptomyces sp. SM12]